MKKTTFTLFAVLFVTSISFSQTFTLKSTDISGQITHKQVFNGFGCTGENISPQLSWENAPEGTKSFAITIYDPDAPTGSGWWHWLVFDLPENTNQVVQNAGNVALNLLPKEAVQSMTNFGQTGYGGPCPPEGHGFHQYIITIYALRVASLKLDVNANPAMVGFNIHANTLEKSSIVSYYKREE